MKGLLIGGMIGGAGGLFIGLLIGVLIVAGFGYWQTGGLNIPYNTEHAEISKRFTVKDITDGVVMNVKHVLTGEAAYHAYAPQDIFIARKTYTQSLWFWTTGQSNDIEVTMTIWGPGEDGKTYAVEFGRHAGNNIQISGFGASVTWQDGIEGYWGLNVKP